MEKYNPQQIEKKWQEFWDKEGYSASKDFSDKPKHYHLIEFPYPSGAGLHVGHCMSYSASDAYCRMKRMKGYEVMYPIGWDAFGLPTENYAIKTGILPQEATKENIAIFTKQIKDLGYAFDWTREIDTTDPNYYKWTQWIFLQFYKHAIIDGKLIKVDDDDKTTPRLAYQSEMPINWCPSCKIGLANEEVINGKCERCGTDAEKKMQKQWMLRITAYADRLIRDLDTVDYLEKIKTQQINWIGRSEGAEVKFLIVIPAKAGIQKNTILDPRVKPEDDSDKTYSLKVFTTRPDTLFGATFMAVAPEHEITSKLRSQISNLKEVENYIDEAKKKSDLERTELAKDKTGVELKGIKAINPINKKEIPIFVADYVLSTYGTGAVMAVPAHDERDWEFAKKYGIKINPVIIKAGTYYRSYLMGANSITDDDLKNLQIRIVEKKKSDRKIEIPKESINQYEDLIKEKLSSGFWNEYIGEKIVFIYKFKNRKIERLQYNSETANRINKLCAEFTNDTSGMTIMEDWLESGADGFYKDYLLSTDQGILISSDSFDGLSSDEAKKKITEKLKEMNSGDFTVNYKLRDWLFSRQHYWGEPIPIIHCEKCGMVPLQEKDLPLTLPIVEKYQPTDTGESPLAAISDWVNVACPVCEGKAKRETDTMPNWAGSSWYYLAYAVKNQLIKIQNQKNENLFDNSKEELKYWMPVDLYNGGMEHTTLHLLYSRFWNKFLFDLGLVPTSEPYQKRIAHGIILGPDGQKMSKSRGNVVNPDEIARKYGADSLRAYIMFIGPYDQESAWSTAGLQGVYRFLTRVWNNFEKISNQEDDKQLLIKLHQTIKGVSEDLEEFRMNTVVSKLMEFNNLIEKVGHISSDSFEKFLILLFTACPHIASELWSRLEKGHIYDQKWPTYDPDILIQEELIIPVQVNGKLRDTVNIPRGTDEAGVVHIAKKSEKVSQYLEGKDIIKVVYVHDRLINFVIKG